LGRNIGKRVGGDGIAQKKKTHFHQVGGQAGLVKRFILVDAPQGELRRTWAHPRKGRNRVGEQPGSVGNISRIHRQYPGGKKQKENRESTEGYRVGEKGGGYREGEKTWANYWAVCSGEGREEEKKAIGCVWGVGEREK